MRGVWAAAVPITPELQVNTYTTGDQIRVSVDIAPDGDFVVAWDSLHDGDLTGVFAQRFDSSGTRQDGEFQVNSLTVGAQQAPAVSGDGDGDFIVAWYGSEDGSVNGVFARRYDSTGAPSRPSSRSTSTPRAPRPPRASS